MLRITARSPGPFKYIHIESIGPDQQARRYPRHPRVIAAIIWDET